MNVLPLIEAKREGQTLSSEQISELTSEYVAGRIPDYQMAALLMAIYFRGLTRDETRALTLAMRDSGEMLSFPTDPRPLVDKHSTGGVGDKVSLVLAPLLACLGFRVPMISGRALGITGGTLDKLESIPGLKVTLTREQIVEQVQRVGCVICSATANMAPADRALYALRDATGTVPSIPLITASILSKKLAEGISALVLDVKFGAAAFMKSLEAARELSREMVDLSESCGVKTRAIITQMDTPTGKAVGNWLEVKEGVDCLEGKGPADLRDWVVDLATHVMALSSRRVEEARKKAGESLDSGEPRQKFMEMIAAQGADLGAFERMLRQGAMAAHVIEVKAEQSGYVTRCDAKVIGEVVRDLVGGRMQRESRIDRDVGVDCLRKPGEMVRGGDALCRVHSSSSEAGRKAAAALQTAFRISQQPIGDAPVIVEVVEGSV